MELNEILKSLCIEDERSPYFDSGYKRPEHLNHCLCDNCVGGASEMAAYVLELLGKAKNIQFENTNDDGVRGEIIERFSALKIDCPECETIIYEDHQYQCGTCGGSGCIFVLPWVKSEVKDILLTNQK